MVLKKLLACRGPSGNEAEVRDALREIVTPYADSVHIDRMGNLVATKKCSDPAAPHVVVCAHMDEVGMIVLGVGEDGLLRYEPVGGIDPRVVVSKRVRVGKEGIPGIIGSKAIHLQSRAEYESVLKHDALCIDIGAKDKASAERHVKPGDYITFDGDIVEFGDGRIKSRALDDRVGCANLAEALDGDYPVNFTAVFTVMEEIGMRGAVGAAWSLRPDVAIALEGTTANDLGDVPEHLRVCEQGKGVAISFMDNSSIAHRGLFRAMCDCAKGAGIPWQIKTGVAGGNDAGAMQRTRGPVPTVVLSVPCRYIHSPASTAALCDIAAQQQLLRAFLKSGARFEKE